MSHSEHLLTDVWDGDGALSVELIAARVQRHTLRCELLAQAWMLKSCWTVVQAVTAVHGNLEKRTCTTSLDVTMGNCTRLATIDQERKQCQTNCVSARNSWCCTWGGGPSGLGSAPILGSLTTAPTHFV